jgi:hypothetical protein
MKAGLIAAMAMLSATAFAFLTLAGAGYWALKSASVDERSFSLAAVIFSPSLALLLVVSSGFGLAVSHLAYRRLTARDVARRGVATSNGA